MACIELPILEECVRQLADTEAMPDARSEKVDKAVMQLVQAYTRCFLHISGYVDDRRLPGRGLLQAKNGADSARHKFALRCLGDVNSTAALIKELAFTDVPLNTDGSFESADLGAGTGVLSVGAAIAALRKGAERIILNIVDIEEPLLEAAAEALGSAGNAITCVPVSGDITERRPYDDIDVRRVRFWISETISDGTPPMILVGNRVIWTERGSHRWDIDPFPAVTDRLTERMPEFSELVQTGRARMFPDIFNDQFRPGNHNALRLPSSESHRTHGPLGTVGWDFIKHNLLSRASTRW